MTTNPTATQDVTLVMARQALYRFVAVSLLDPKSGSWEQLDALRDSSLLADAAALIRDLPAAHAERLGICERPLADLDPRRVLDRLPSTRRQLNDEYENAFGLLVSAASPPYETEYIPSKFEFQRSNTLGDISGFYRAFGVRPSVEHPERPDHIVLELEFMATLLALERRAWEVETSDRERRLAVCQDAQRRFLQEHLAWWAPAFASLLATEASGGFYEAAGNCLAALIPAERTLLGVDPSPRVAAPSTQERPEECEGCLSACE